MLNKMPQKEAGIEKSKAGGKKDMRVYICENVYSVMCERQTLDDLFDLNSILNKALLT